jgi:hypothetical protein
MTELHKEIFEASELGWDPGKYATSIYIGSSMYSLIETKIDPDGDVIAWIYRNVANTAQITVLND